MKVLFAMLHPSGFPMGGAEQIVLDTCVGVRERYGVQVAAAVNRGDLASRLEHVFVPVFPLEWSKLKSLQTLLMLKKAIHDFQPDIIHAFHRYPVFLIKRFIKTKAKLLFTAQVMQKDKRALFEYGDFAVACHETVRQNLIRHFHVPSHCVVTIPNAVKERRPDFQELEKLKAQYPKNPGEMRGLFAGRLEEQKGHVYLIEALKQLPEAYRNKIKIFLAGDGTLKSSLVRKVREAQLEKQVIFLGYTSQVPEWLALSDFLVLPSLWEGLPLVIPEAYSLGRAVLATEIPGNRESVRHKKTGFLVTPRDPQSLKKGLQYFLDHPGDVQNMGHAARQWWQTEFSFDLMIKRNYELYQKLLSQR